MRVGDGLTRRGLLIGAAAMATIAQTQAQRAPGLEAVQALAFDVQGTCVDFYMPILRMGEAVNRVKGLALDWAALSLEWRDLYRAALDQIIAGQRPWPSGGPYLP
jgi:2-haloacid dehalogenase